MFGKEKEAKAAALAVLRAAQPGDEVCVVDFNDDAFLDADLSTDFRKATEALQHVEARGGSALRDAIQMSTDLLQQKAHNRKVLVLVTDGDDTSSTSTEEQLREKLKTSGVLVSSIALRDGQGWRALSELAALTGGVLYHPLAPAEVENGASAIMRDARSK
jgi:Mg-chelatase subunit ChlD